jgi:hypothetical protein
MSAFRRVGIQFEVEIQKLTPIAADRLRKKVYVIASDRRERSPGLAPAYATLVE